MRTIQSIFALALCAVAITLASCEPKNTPDGEKEYAFKGVYSFNKEASADDSTLVVNAFSKAGVPLAEYSLVLKGDSADVLAQLTDKMAKVAETVAVLPESVKLTIGVKGTEKKYVSAENDKEHPVKMWYSKQIGTPENDDAPWQSDLLYINHDYRYVKYFRTTDGVDNGQYFVPMFIDLNTYAGGDDIYLVLEHCLGSRADKENGEFIWEEKFAKDFITDVIVVYGKNAPNTLKVEGRTYKWQNGTCDLNKGAGGEYIWLYTTTDPYPGYNGYYLITGGDNHKCCRGLMLYPSLFSGSKDFTAADYLNDPYTYKGHRIIERVVKAYDYNQNLKCVGEAECNKGAGGLYIKLIMTYASK